MGTSEEKKLKMLRLLAWRLKPRKLTLNTTIVYQKLTQADRITHGNVGGVVVRNVDSGESWIGGKVPFDNFDALIANQNGITDSLEATISPPGVQLKFDSDPVDIDDIKFDPPFTPELERVKNMDRKERRREEFQVLNQHGFDVVLRVFNSGDVHVLSPQFEFTIEDQFEARELAHNQRVALLKKRASNEKFRVPKLAFMKNEVPDERAHGLLVTFNVCNANEEYYIGDVKALSLMHQPAEVLTHEAQAKAELYGDFIDKFTSNLTNSQIEKEKDFSLKERITAYPEEMEKIAWSNLEQEFQRANEPVKLSTLMPPVVPTKKSWNERTNEEYQKMLAKPIHKDGLAKQEAQKQLKVNKVTYDTELVKMDSLPSDFRFKESTMELARSNPHFWLGDPKVTKQGNQILHYADNWERQQESYARAREKEEASWGYRIQKVFNLRT